MGMEDPFLVRLEGFRRRESPDVVLIVEGDLRLARLVVSWRNLDVLRRAILPALPDRVSDGAAWSWLWEGVEFSREALGVASGLPLEELDRHLGVLIGNRIIYPDGTANSFVERYVRERAEALLAPETRRRAKVSGKAGTIASLASEAAALSRRGEHSRAREVLAKILSRSDARPEERSSALRLTAHTHIDEGNGHLADEWFDRILDLPDVTPLDLGEARVARGYSREAQGREDEALAEFEACLALEGAAEVHRGSALLHSARIHFGRGDAERAREALERFSTLRRPHPNEKKEAKELLARIATPSSRVRRRGDDRTPPAPRR